jgi:plastocyanin
MRFTVHSLLLAVLITFSFALSGCEEKNHDEGRAAAPPLATEKTPLAPHEQVALPPPLGSKGTLKGKVLLTGRAPEMAEQLRGSDPFCAKTKMKDEEVVENSNHTLRNVLVHINGAPPAEPPKATLEIEQTQCNYAPRVTGAVAGQTILIRNGDPILHNVHTYKGFSTLFNVAQVPGAPNIEKKFNENGALLKLKCDVHQWMTGYVWVQNNPYFAVTGSDGSFEIKNVPAGKYSVEAWHERFGVKKGEVTINGDRPSELNFEFTGSELGSK